MTKQLKESPENSHVKSLDSGQRQNTLLAIRSVMVAMRALAQQADEAPLSPEALRDWIAHQHDQLAMAERDIVTTAGSASRSGRSALFGKVATGLIEALGTVSSANRRQSLQVALGALMDVTEARRGFIALRQHDGTFAFPVVQTKADPTDAHPELTFSQGILQAALEGPGPIVTVDARADARFSHKKSVHALNLRAVLVVPLVARGRPFGALGLDNPSVTASFSEADQRSAEEFVRVIGPILERDLELVRIEEHRLERSARLRREFDCASVIGCSDQILDVLEVVSRVASTDAAVLITGETGTGKELIAECIHANSGRRNQHFVPVNCSALPAELIESELFGHERGAFTGAAGKRIGRFEKADEGTIFLDEVGELSAPAQAKILRVLQDGSYDRVGASKSRRSNVRVISATNRDINAEVEAGRFRRDLAFRLNVIRIHVPPLRDRGDDIELLAQHLLGQLTIRNAGHVPRFHASALAALEAYPWPGNVRELKNVIERAVALSRGPDITVDLLPPEIAGPKSAAREAETLKTALREYKRRLVRRALDCAGGDHNAAAQSLGVHPKYLYQLLREFTEP